MSPSNPRRIGAIAALAVGATLTPFALATPAGAQTPAVLFGPETSYAVGTDPVSTASADFDSDGSPDLAAANVDDATVSVLMGAGDGTFAPAQAYPAGDFPQSIVVGDFDRNGDPDIVVANFFAPTASDPDAPGTTVSLLLGNGDGTFQPPVPFATGARPSVAAADLNRDGRLDLAVTSFDDDALSILLGNGDGTFQDQQVIALGATPTPDGAPAIGDLNGDGRPDIAIVVGEIGQPGSVLVLPGNGDGTYGTPVTVPAGADPSQVAIADLDRDGAPDLAITNLDADKVSVRRGNGRDPLKFKKLAGFEAGDQPVALAVADLNGDGRPDLIVTNFEAGQVSVLTGRGKHGFAPRQAFTAGSGAFSVTVADLDRDGRPDLAVPRQEVAGAVSVLLNTTPF